MRRYFPLKAIIAITAIAVLEGVALGYGQDGVSLAAAIAAIAGLGGFAIGQAQAKKGNDKPPE